MEANDPGSEPLTLLEAVEVFGRSFALVRSVFSPSEFVQIGRLFAVRDSAPRRHDPRATEFFSVDLPPEAVLAGLRNDASGRFFLCAIESVGVPLDQVRDAYKKAGFRLLRREPIMVASLFSLASEPSEAPFAIRRVRTSEEETVLRREAGRRQMLPEHINLDDSPCRVHYAQGPEGPIGWVRSTRTGRDTYVSDMYVRPAYRRRGIGRSLLQHMMEDDRRLGAHWSVLVASSAGAQLYPHAGYRQIGTLQIFSPPRAKASWLEGL
jgi:GNAT superfamily N-acetyltransferase